MSPPSPHAGPAVVVDGLVKRYGGREALRGISFRIEHGEVFALLGPNGAGKTTTVEILEGLRTADAGSVRVLGLDPRRRRRALMPRVGVMLQEGGLYPGLRVAEAARLFSAYYPGARDPDELVALAGLADDAATPVRRLSGGQRQSLSLALALAGRPEVAFLDEPTAGLDARARARTWDTVRRLRGDGVTVLLTTHNLEEAERLADRIAIIDRGETVALGTPAALTEMRGRLEFRTDKPIDATALSHALGDAEVGDLGENRYAVEERATPVVVQRLAIWLAERETLLVELSSGRRTLEETFLRLTGREGAP